MKPSGTAPADAVSDGDASDDSAPQRSPTVPVGARSPTARLTDTPSGETTVDPDRTERFIGRILAGRYELRRVLGRGGMGLVFEAKHITVGRSVAIKILRQDLARSTEAVARFHREAKAAASVGSEHIVEVFDFGYSDEGDAYIAMELLEGTDLGRIIRAEGALAPDRAVRIAKQVARALECAHAKGIVHRDLKSENIFLVRRDDGEFVKLLDFGISKVSEGDEGRGPMTSEGVVMGTPHYMAPEQAMSSIDADHRIDLYALGCLLYEMLTGRLPFTGKNPVEVVFKHVHEAPVPPSEVRKSIPVGLDGVVLKALAKNRDERFANAAEMAEALELVRVSLVTGERMAQVATRRRRGRGRGLWAAGVVVLLAAGAVGAARLMKGRGAGEPGHRAVHVGTAAGLGGPREAVTSSDAGRGVRAAAPSGADTGAAAREAVLSVRATPRNAEIVIDGRVAGTGEVDEPVPVGSTHAVVVRAEGYVVHSEPGVMVGENGASRVIGLLAAAGNVTAIRISRDGGARNAVLVRAGSDAGLTANPGGPQHLGDGLMDNPYGGDAGGR